MFLEGIHMAISKRKAEKCITHHSACDCHEYKTQEMERALRIIQTWASFDVEGKWFAKKLSPSHVVELCDKALNCLKV